MSAAHEPVESASGSASTLARENTSRDSTPCVSTIGDWPLTVTVSASSPSASSAFTVAVNAALSSRPSRTSVPNPCSAKVTL
jgi:hypothetical protein